METKRDQDDQLDVLLRNEAEDHKMYPSDMVWENIRTAIHGNKSWPALTVISVLIISALSVFSFYNYPPQALIDKKIKVSQQLFEASDHNEANDEQIARSVEAYSAQINPAKITEQTMESLFAPIQQTELLAFEPGNIKLDITNSVKLKEILPTEKREIANTFTQQKPDNTNTLDKQGLFDIQDAEQAENGKQKPSSKFDGIPFTGTDKDEDPNAENYSGEIHTKGKSADTKWSFQLYATPSVSYRKLEDESSPAILNTSGVNGNIDKTVKHKPAMGIEFGTVVKYSLTKNFRLVSGLQFNIRQYHIDAYRSYGMATFAFINNNHLDSISLFSMFSNTSTNSAPYLSTKLDNKLYQLSIPIGIEWDVLNGKVWGVSVGAAFQPTFTLNKSVYMISSDYKYYADGTPFFRKWNYNSNFEINITYKTGNITWFAGPQIRYQHLPTYNDVYSIKEHRIDYGLKIGFSKPLH